METATDKTGAITILLVEDEPDCREILGRMLAMKIPTARLVTADNGESGLELYQKHRPDLVITDLYMPVMNGLRMAGAIRKLKPDALIIVLTAHNDTGYLLDAIELGIAHYVLKPINHSKLFAAIDQCLERVALERQVNEQDAFIRKLSRAVERSPSMVIIAADDGTIDYVNPRFTEVTGYCSDEIVGRNYRLQLAETTVPDVAEEIWDVVCNGRDWRGELQCRKKAGELYWADVSVSSIVNDGGSIINFVVEMEDISGRKQREEEIAFLNRELAERAEELEAMNIELEAFNSSVSHDLRTPLTIINGYNQVLRELYGKRLDPEGLGFLDAIAEETLHMNKLIGSLLDFARLGRQSLNKTDVYLSNLALGIVEELKQTNPARRVSCLIQDDVYCTGDPVLLRVVLENLIGNAWKYTGRKESPLIEFGARNIHDVPTYFVRDNGAGFDMAQADSLFVPFKRLHDKEEFSGNGIGLATVARIIKRHNGRIWAEGIPDGGATFFFTIDSLPNTSVP